ncbi:MAG: hypothetical protein ABII00_00695 [Elusimicrobiota bacterium]
MAEVVFEYTDEQGRLHRVDSIDKVPKERLRSMVAVGLEEPEQAPAKAPPASGFRVDLLLPVLLAVLFVRCRGFLARAILATLAIMWGLYAGWGWFVESDYSRTEIAVQDGLNPAAQESRDIP